MIPLETSYPFASGDIAELEMGWYTFFAEPERKIYEIRKTARNSRDNDLLLAEYMSSRHARQTLRGPYLDCVPVIHSELVGSFRTNSMPAYIGFFSAEDIHKILPKLEGEDLVWIWKRLLGLLCGVNHEVIHGAILPSHVLLFPDNNLRSSKDPRRHSIRLIDWCYSVNRGIGRLDAWVPAYEDFYPPEVLNKRHVGPWTDIYMTAKLIMFLSGEQDPRKVIGPNFGMLLESCLRKDYTSRMGQAQIAYERLQQAAHSVYGDPKFHRFILPL